MNLDCDSSRIYDSYSENHPIISISVDNTEEIRDLANKIDQLFSPIQQSHKVNYFYQQNGRGLDLKIYDQPTQEAIDAVQEAKKKLKDFVDYNNFPDWLKILIFIFTIGVIFYGFIFKIIFGLLNWIHKQLKAKFGLSNVQSIGIIAGVIALIIVLTAWLADEAIKSNPPITQTNIESNSPSTIPEVRETVTPTATKISPEQAFKDYYSIINSKEYEQGWNKLSPQLRNDQQKHPNGYQDYIDWWTKVAFVDVLNTTLISESSEKATVEANLKYIIEDNGRIINQTLRFDFIWDQPSNSWLIDRITKIE